MLMSGQQCILLQNFSCTQLLLHTTQAKFTTNSTSGVSDQEWCNLYDDFGSTYASVDEV